ncbi:MAG: NFACT family protein [Nanoarchaeota archaeon]
MKTDISSLELDYLMHELSFVKGSRVDKIFLKDKKDMFIQLYKAEFGKKLLRINVPHFLYATEDKPEFGHPSSFGMALRKRLHNLIITGFTNMKNERVVKITFEKKNEFGVIKRYFLYCELFLKGNLILVDEHGDIELVAEHQVWKDREIKPKAHYTVPQKKSLRLKEDLEKDLVKYLAEDMSLGGEFAEEILYRVHIDKHRHKLSESEIALLEKEIDDLTHIRDRSAYIYTKDKKKYAYPFQLSSFTDYDKIERFDTFNAALDHLFTRRMKTQKLEVQKKEKEKKLGKFEKIIKTQEEQLKKNERIIEESTKKGDLIYQNYAEITSILDQLKKARETMSWKEIKKNLKNPMIKKISEKNGKIVLDL